MKIWNSDFIIDKFEIFNLMKISKKIFSKTILYIPNTVYKLLIKRDEDKILYFFIF